MHFKIEHTTLYRYSAPVFPEPQHFYFYPHHRPYLHLINFDLQVHPDPSGLTLRLDAENNLYHQCWFNGEVDFLKILVTVEVEASEFNPFDFLVEEIPKTNHQDALRLYLNFRVNLSEECKNWVQAFKTSPDHDPIDVLKQLCKKIHSGWQHAFSYLTDLLDPNQCFLNKTGSCRDLSWMMIQMLRFLEFPARFVSGYSYNPELDGHELHAWVEAWVPSAGWIGLDPSSGLFTTSHYIPLAASYHPANTLPVQGTFRGDATSEMETAVSIVPV